jgi:hypothetical protein
LTQFVAAPANAAAMQPVQRVDTHMPDLPSWIHEQTYGAAHSWSPVVSALHGPPNVDFS